MDSLGGLLNATEILHHPITRPSPNAKVSNVVDLTVQLVKNVTKLYPRVDLQIFCDGFSTNFEYLQSDQVTITPEGVLFHCISKTLSFVLLTYDEGDINAFTSDPIQVEVIGLGVPITYVVTSCMSILALCVVLGCYVLSPRLQAWPGPLEMRKTFHVLLTCVLLLFTNIMHLRRIPAKQFCSPTISLLTQWAIMGMQSWYLCMSANVFSSISNPFLAPESKMVWYTLISTCLPGATAISIVIAQVYGYRPSEGVCWVRDREDQFNFASSLLVYIPVTFIVITGVVIMSYAIFKLNSEAVGMTTELRKKALLKLKMNVMLFTFYWIVTGAVLFSIYIEENLEQSAIIQNRGLSFLFAFLAGALGVFDATGWAIVHADEFRMLLKEWHLMPQKIKEKMRDDQKTAGDGWDISLPLRREFIFQTTTGIKGHLQRKREGILKPIHILQDHEDFIRKVSMADDRMHKPKIFSMHSWASAEPPGDSHYSILPDAKSTNTPHPRRQSSDLTADTLGSSCQRNSHHSRHTDVFDLAPFQPHIVERNPTQESLKSIEFKAYEWRRFAYLRQFWNMDEKDISSSLSGAIDQMAMNFSEGASGSFFFLTVDRKYLVKTMTRSELQVLISILPSYCRHMAENPNSLITKYVGIYSVKLFNHREYFSLMTNILLTSPGRGIKFKYDLKGSTINRNGKVKKSGGTLKDNDFRSPLEFPKALGIQLLHQLDRDSSFLQGQNIMDYSLLVGVEYFTYSTEYLSNHNSSSGEEKSIAELHDRFSQIAAARVTAPGVYYLGLIDILQEWDFWKWLERAVKICFKCHCADYDKLSCVPPKQYQERFVEFMRTSVIYKDGDENQGSKSNSTLEKVQPAPRASIVVSSFSM